MTNYSLKFKALSVLLAVTMAFTACTSSWVAQAQAIVAILGPAVGVILNLIAAFGGKTVPLQDVAFVQTWTQQLQTDFGIIGQLLDKYNAAEATAKPGILTEIDTALQTAQGQLNQLLPALHITDVATVAKVTSLIGAVISSVESLMQLVAIAQGKAAGKRAVKAQNAKSFKAEFNARLVAASGNAALDAVAASLVLK